MQKRIDIKSMVIGAALGVVMMLSAAAAITETWTLPPTRGYRVQVGSVQLWAKSIKVNGSMAKLETDNGTLWLVNGALVTPTN